MENIDRLAAQAAQYLADSAPSDLFSISEQHKFYGHIARDTEAKRQDLARMLGNGSL